MHTTTTNTQKRFSNSRSWLKNGKSIKRNEKTGQWYLVLTSYAKETHKVKKIRIYANTSLSDIDAMDYLSKFIPILRQRLAYLKGDISKLTPEVLKEEVDNIKVELGGTVTRTYSEPRSLHYFFADCSTNELINFDGLNGLESERELGIKQPRINSRTNAVISPKTGKGKTLPYNNGRCYLAAFRDLKTNQITFNKQTTQVVKEQIMGN